MSQVYDIAGISRQGHHQWMRRKAALGLREGALLTQARHLRQAHPRMGCRKMHLLLGPDMGRDRFEALLLCNGLRVRAERNYARTTYAHPSARYPNLIKGLVITRVDQLWVSDITYVRFQERFFYVTLITDVYSRRILAAVASRSLAAEANIKALKQAIRMRGGAIAPGLIHHSDHGGQYVHRQYIRLLQEHRARISMGNHAWENAHAERVNGIVKNEYLLPEGIKNFRHLTSSLRSTCRKINHIRPHGQLPGMRTPAAFEALPQTHPDKINYQVNINY